MIAPGGCALPAVDAGGMPSRIMRVLLPDPAAGHPWPALGIPPASTAGPDLLRDRGRRAATPTSNSGGSSWIKRHSHARATPTSATPPAPDLRTEAKKLPGPSRTQGVCVQPAMDGRRPALGAGRGQAG